MFVYLHAGGCGKPAFLYDHMPARGEIPRSKFARTLTGEHIKPYSVRICGTCGQPLKEAFLQTKNLISQE
jgi:hypothetical protein